MTGPHDFFFTVEGRAVPYRYLHYRHLISDLLYSYRHSCNILFNSHDRKGQISYSHQMIFTFAKLLSNCRGFGGTKLAYHLYEDLLVTFCCCFFFSMVGLLYLWHIPHFHSQFYLFQVIYKKKKKRCGMIANETTVHKRPTWHRNYPL